MLGYSREELVGKTIADLIGSDQLDRLEHEKQLLTDGRAHVSEWALRCKDGTRVTAEVSATILPDGRWQGFVRDISERKRLEDALRSYSCCGEKFRPTDCCTPSFAWCERRIFTAERLSS
jgi:PAS domain S-box-containing protein